MSREVRRVPLDFKHPAEPNPYWREQIARRLLRGEDLPTLHRAQERFVGLVGDYPEALARWEAEGEDLRNRTGHHWTFSVEYHLTGYQGRDDTAPAVHPFYVSDEETAVTIRDEDHLHVLLTAQHADEQPDPAHYMPVFAPAEALGWCLYETVSEGTPITPVFATAAELVDHLATVGTEWGGPLRRAAAEQIVTTGHTMGSLVSVGGRVLNSADDADVIAGIGGAA